MLKEATRFCELIEDEQLTDAAALVELLRIAVIDLLAVAYQLPDVEPDTDDDVPDVAYDEWIRRFRALGTRLDMDCYWTTVVVPFDSDGPDATIGSLCDDLADIWHDLVEGLRGRQAGMTANDVLWHWKFHFEAHWGKHAVEALRVLHSLNAN